jgi:hypothetical protein
MLKILSDEDNKLRLEDGSGLSVGWIHGRAIGFRGFATESIARKAATAAWRALDASLRQQYPGWPHYEPAFDQLRTVHDGVSEWFHDGTTEIARLLRPHRRAYDHSYGIELMLPSFASEGVAITAAQSIAKAVIPHRDELATPA